MVPSVSSGRLCAAPRSLRGRVGLLLLLVAHVSTQAACGDPTGPPRSDDLWPHSPPGEPRVKPWDSCEVGPAFDLDRAVITIITTPHEYDSCAHESVYFVPEGDDPRFPPCADHGGVVGTYFGEREWRCLDGHIRSFDEGASRTTGAGYGYYSRIVSRS